MNLRTILNAVNQHLDDVEEVLEEIQEELVRERERIYPLPFRRNGKELVQM